MNLEPNSLFNAVSAWLQTDSTVVSAVLFGSQASGVMKSDTWSDLDLHVITPSSRRLENIDWARTLVAEDFCGKVVRPATAGVKKITAVFKSGQIDMVVVPLRRIDRLRRLRHCARVLSRPTVQVALNEMATCLRSGYRFLKGESEWGAFYTWVVRDMSGVRLSDMAIVQLADAFVCDLLWTLQKLERGEMMAAQYALHRQLSEVNFRLIRERRLRRCQPLPSFGIGRHVEFMLPRNELSWLEVDARLLPEEIHRASWKLYDGLCNMMKDLVPIWNMSDGMRSLLNGYRTLRLRTE